MRFVDPRSTPFVPPRSRGELPHLEKPGGTYFVTFRLADAIFPAAERKTTDGRRNDLTPAELMADYDPPLQLGSCLLGKKEAADVVHSALRHFDQKRYSLEAWCVMPNHVHVEFSPWIGHPLEKVLHSWKSFAAHEINRVLGRAGHLWERESFDHLIRTAELADSFISYVEQNPVVAGLVREAKDWPYSSAYFRSVQR